MADVRMIAVEGGSACTECYVYGFIDEAPVDRHYCIECTAYGARGADGGLLETVAMSFEEWKNATPRIGFRNLSYERFLEIIRVVHSRRRDRENGIHRADPNIGIWNARAAEEMKEDDDDVPDLVEPSDDEFEEGEEGETNE